MASARVAERLIWLVQGWEWKNEGKRGFKKVGWISTVPGSKLLLKVCARPPQRNGFSMCLHIRGPACVISHTRLLPQAATPLSLMDFCCTALHRRVCRLIR